MKFTSTHTKFHLSFLTGLVIILPIMLMALISKTVSPNRPFDQFPTDRLLSPSASHLLGTDEFGRDIFSRVLQGAFNSLSVSIVGVAASAILGISFGITAGYFGGWIDMVLMRFMDLLFAFPGILMALFIVTALGSGAMNTALAIAIVYLPIFTRVVRGQTLSVRNRDFVVASQALGASHLGRIIKHILPNILSTILVQISLALSWAILVESSLSYLGLGTLPPEPSLGSMLIDSRPLMEIAPWMAVAPGLAIMLSVLGFNLLSDGLQNMLNPYTM